MASSKLNRRSFFFKSSGSVIATFAVANASIYTIGSAFRALDGSFVAGAKGACYQHTMTSYTPIYTGPVPGGFTGSCTSSVGGSSYSNNPTPTPGCTGCGPFGGCTDTVSSTAPSNCP